MYLLINGILFLAVSIMPSTSEYPVKVFNFLTTEVLKKCHSANPSYDLASMASSTTVSHWTTLGQTLGYCITLFVLWSYLETNYSSTADCNCLITRMFIII